MISLGNTFLRTFENSAEVYYMLVKVNKCGGLGMHMCMLTECAACGEGPGSHPLSVSRHFSLMIECFLSLC